MKKCIKLAQKARGKTSPNPLVGCVVINDEGNIISTGYHKLYGQNHAERDALLKIEDAKGLTLIVNLEPCSHYGKTPPCADFIIEKGIKRVVYGMQDPNPKVSGQGLQKLINAGIEVVGPVLENECKSLNEIFIKNIVEQKTFVALKTATTLDGKIATYSGKSKWITSEKARNCGRVLRSYYDAILTSSATIIADNPKMVHKKKIILDRALKTDIHSNIYNQGEIFVFHDEKLSSNLTIANVSYIKTPLKCGKLDIDFILSKLFELGIMSVFVESGGGLNGAFLDYVDKLYQFVAPKILGDNSGKSCFDGKNVDNISDCVNFKIEKVENYSPDLLITYNKNL